MKLIHLYPSFQRFGGAQKVVETLFISLNNDINSYLGGFHPYERVDNRIKNVVPKEKYLHLSLFNLWKLKKFLVVSHDRKITTILVIASLFIKVKVVHVAHNVYFNYGKLSLFPDKIIAVSHAVKNNLIDYFNVKKGNIYVIYNGIADTLHDDRTVTKKYNPKEIRILHLGHIQESKQQLKIVNFLKDKIPAGLSIHFAGEGEDAKKLQELIHFYRMEKQFKYLGFCKDIVSLVQKYDYVLLFSKIEGLGLSLVEACMLNKPVITNSSEGTMACGEVCQDHFNGFIANSFDELEIVLKNLTAVDVKRYEEMCKNARMVYKEKFTLDEMRQKYLYYLAEFDDK